MNVLQRAACKTTLRNFPLRHPPVLRQAHGRPRNGQRNIASDESAASKSPRPQVEPPHAASEVSAPAAEGGRPPIDIPSLLWHQRLGPVTDFLGWFHRTQNRRPYMVQLCSSLVVYLFGDLLAQDIGGEPYDWQRTLRMLAIGGISSIPGYKWFMFLGNHFNYGSKVLSIATKVVVQQAVFTPVFNTYFFGMQAILTGQPPSGVFERIKQTVPKSIVRSLMLWPAVTAFSFAFILPQYRFMFSGIFAVSWQTYLSFLNRRAELAGTSTVPVEKSKERLLQEQN